MPRFLHMWPLATEATVSEKNINASFINILNLEIKVVKNSAHTVLNDIWIQWRVWKKIVTTNISKVCPDCYQGSRQYWWLATCPSHLFHLSKVQSTSNKFRRHYIVHFVKLIEALYEIELLGTIQVIPTLSWLGKILLVH